MLKKVTYAFIDASNLFYGGVKSLGWKVDYQKLIKYLHKKYNVTKTFYYGGVELNGFIYSLLDDESINVNLLLKYLQNKINHNDTSGEERLIINKQIQRIKFYLKLSQFGYILRLKPVKIFRDSEGNTTKKANCDVDMTFDMMLHIRQYDDVLVLSGDGDFVIILKYLKKLGKNVTVLARGERTAREIKQLMSGNFRDFGKLKTYLEFISKK